MLTMLGIPNCDTIKKARRFLEARAVPFRFRDLRREPLSRDEWAALASQDADDRLVNVRSPSFRKTGLAKGALTPESKTEALLAQPTAMKRPVMLEADRLAAIGFDEALFAERFAGEDQ